jgi:glycerol-3-phosphate acyltransferase PlsY
MESFAPAILVLSYLLGSIPFGVLLGRGMKGKDPRSAGSGNIGFTNVLRVVGALPAALTLLGDMGKGALAAYLGRVLAPEFAVYSGLFAILGHCYPIFLRFHGGKAVATSFGALAILYPLVSAITFSVWIIAVLIWRYISLGSLVAFGCLPIIMTLLYPDRDSILFSMATAVLVYLRHRENISRLVLKKEGKIF